MRKRNKKYNTRRLHLYDGRKKMEGKSEVGGEIGEKKNFPSLKLFLLCQSMNGSSSKTVHGTKNVYSVVSYRAKNAKICFSQLFSFLDIYTMCIIFVKACLFTSSCYLPRMNVLLAGYADKKE
jgi:hypothetical protein